MKFKRLNFGFKLWYNNDLIIKIFIISQITIYLF